MVHNIKFKIYILNFSKSLLEIKSKKPFIAANKSKTCFSTDKICLFCCLIIKTNLTPRFKIFCVDKSNSAAKEAKLSISRYCANSNLRRPATCFMPLVWAADPILLTDNPTLIAGRIPSLKSLVSKKIWPSVNRVE